MMTTVHKEAGQRLELEQCAVSKREIQHQLTEMWRQGLITASSTGHTTKTRAKHDEQKITVIYTYSYRPF